MKRRFKINLYLVILLFGISIFLVSCLKENLQEKTNAVQTLSRNLDVTGYRLPTDSIFKVNKTLKHKISSNFSSNNNGFGSRLTSETYGFSIDTSFVQIIISDTFESYTFVVERDVPLENVLENYVLTLYGDEYYSQMLMSYPIIETENDLDYDISNASVLMIDDESLLSKRISCDYPYQEIIEFDSDAGECIQWPCASLDHWGSVEAGDCTLSGSDLPYDTCSGAWVVTGCNTGGSSDSGSGDGNTGGNNTPPDEEEVPVVPLGPNYIELIENCINGIVGLGETDNTTIDDNVLSSLNLNSKQLAQMYNYLQENSCDETAQEFILIATEELLEDSEIDIENEIIIDETFKDTETKCIHDLLKSGNNFYSDMLSDFSNNDARGLLKLKIGSTLNDDWGNTFGSPDNANEFAIITSNEIENNSSNLMRMVTLSHEMIHAYMFLSLENWGYITYGNNGQPILEVVCYDGIDYDSINLNTLTIKQRFVAIICAFNQNNTLTENWTHDLFNVWSFDVDLYKDKLKELLINEHDWNGENLNFKNEAISVFGNNWIEEVAEAASWIGLESTPEYADYHNSYSSSLSKFTYILDIRYKLLNAKTNCL